MEVETIRKALHTHPFQPFTLRLVDGREFYIPHPDFVAVSRRNVVVINTHDESASMLEPMLISSLEMPYSPSPGAKPQANGPASG